MRDFREDFHRILTWDVGMAMRVEDRAAYLFRPDGDIAIALIAKMDCEPPAILIVPHLSPTSYEAMLAHWLVGGFKQLGYDVSPSLPTLRRALREAARRTFEAAQKLEGEVRELEEMLERWR